VFVQQIILPLPAQPGDAQTLGLSSKAAQRKLAEVGANEPAPARRRGVFIQLFVLLGNPLVIVLLIASFISLLVGDPVNASIIVLMVLLSVALNFVQNYRSQQAADRLREQVAPTATVLRDGKWGEIARRELVPGDVIRLSAGDLVPADARLFEVRSLHVQEAALTGESMPAEKEAARVPLAGNATPPRPSADVNDPSMVFLGTSVVSGSATAVVVATGAATAFGDIAARLATRPPRNEFERGTRAFGLFIMATVSMLALFVFLLGIALGRAVLESLLFAVALAVGLTPEFLPMITTITLSQGAVKMARQQVIVKNLASMQNFGSIDVLCSDKTGTLTSDKMELDDCLDPLGNQSARALLLGYLASYYDTGVRSPLDAAVIEQPLPDANAYRSVGEVPFDFERRRLSVIVMGADGERLLIAKGAPEGIIAQCTQYEAAGKVSPLDATTQANCHSLFERLSGQGDRVLAVAYRTVPEQPGYSEADERDLTLVGYLTFLNPPLPEAAAVLQALRCDEIDLKVLTGDNEMVARNICAQVGIDTSKLLLGADLAQMSDEQLDMVVGQTSIFARVSPAQKNRIILSLKRCGHVVGYIGDGINDAPSLHAADVGISVAGAVDVAREAADIILLQPSLQVLHGGIIEGRKSFGNVMKYLLMGTSSNFGNMFSMAAAFAFLPFLPMLPTQILLNNFLYDLAQVSIATDVVDSTFIRKPHRWDIGLIRRFMIFIGPLSSIYDFLTFFVLLSVFHASEQMFHTGWFVESLATQVLVIFIIRTAGNPLRSRPSLPLTITSLTAVVVGIVLPFSPLATLLGFVPLPGWYFVFLVLVVGTYLLLVEFVKRRLMAQLVD
jgi:P-type Mg2+ transporter